MPKPNSVVAIFESHSQAGEAVRALQKSGFDMTKMSVAGRDLRADERVADFSNAGDRMRFWGKRGAFWGGVWGILFGAASFAIPDVGPVAVGGPLASWIVSALESAAVVGGLSVLGAGLYSIGIPRDSVLKYEVAIKADKFVLVAHGTPDDVARARAILAGAHPAELELHNPSAVAG